MYNNFLFYYICMQNRIISYLDNISYLNKQNIILFICII